MWVSHGRGQTPSLSDIHGLILAQSVNFFINPPEEESANRALLSPKFWKISPENSRWTWELFIPVIGAYHPSKNIWSAMFVTTVKSFSLGPQPWPWPRPPQLCPVPDPYGLAFISVLMLMTIHSQLNFMSLTQKLKKSQLTREPDCFTPLNLHHDPFVDLQSFTLLEKG